MAFDSFELKRDEKGRITGFTISPWLGVALVIIVLTMFNTCL